MPLRDYVQREIRYSVRCEICREREDSVFEGTRTAAARTFKVSGWEISRYDNCVCPSCVSKGKFNT